MNDPEPSDDRWLFATRDSERMARVRMDQDRSMMLAKSAKGNRKGKVRWMSRRGLWAGILLLTPLVWQALAGSACANDLIKIEDYRWGFNGKVALNRFNLLSILIRNDSPQPVDGDLVLRKTLGGGTYIDAKAVEPILIAPFSARWVQFYPFINSTWGNNISNEKFKLELGRLRLGDLDEPRIAKYQRVLLDDPSALRSSGGVLKRMPENLFPSFVSATDALQVVGLDHEPRNWIPTQKEAFLDWIHLGGTVILFQSSTSKFPEFTGPLAVLNSPLDEHRYGSGRILKMTMTPAQFHEETARQLLVGLPKNLLLAQEKPEDPIDVVDPTEQTQPAQNNYSDGADPLTAKSFMDQLKEMTKPEHNWILLHFMFWVYILMVFPGCYLLGKRWSDFRIVYGGLLGTVTLFSVLFSIVGQRGYGEATAVHTVAIARSLPDGGLDVASWSNVFVTSGAKYLIKHNARGSLYSTCSESEEVNGVFNNGIDGSFYVDIPPFSNREFALRTKLASGSPVLTIESLQVSEGRISELILDVKGVKLDEVKYSYVLVGNRFFTLTTTQGKLKLGSDAGDAVAVLNIPQLQNWNRRNYPYGYQSQAQETPETRFAEMMTPLLSRSLNVTRESEARQVRLPGDTARVFLYCRITPEFAVQNDRLGAQNGYLLYCIDIALTDKLTDGK